MTMKQTILTAYNYRHATKQFDDQKKISAEDFNFILETGHLSPSSFGFEPWKFVVVQNMELREKLKPVSWGAQRTLPTASHFVLLLSRTAPYMAADSKHIQHMMKDVQELPAEVIESKGNLFHKFINEDFNYHGNDRAIFEWASRQTYIALGNMMTAAALVGIDSCPIEGFDKAKVEGILREEGILTSDEFGISCMVAFGYRLNEPRPKTRQPIEDVVQWVN